MACGTVDCWNWIQRDGRQIGRCCSSYWWSKCSLGRCGRLGNLEGPWTITDGMLLVIGLAGEATEVSTGMLGGGGVAETTLLTEVCAAVLMVLSFGSNILVFVELVPYRQHSLKRLVARRCLETVFESPTGHIAVEALWGLLPLVSFSFLLLAVQLKVLVLFWVVKS